MGPDPVRAPRLADAPRRGSLADRLEPRPTVLVVEDDGSIAGFLRAYFQASGNDVVHLDPDSPQQVGDWVAEHRPACVLLDLRLRGFDGMAVYHLLRRNPANEGLPVVVLTADPSLARKAARDIRPGDTALTKPFDVRALFDLVAGRIQVAGG